MHQIVQLKNHPTCVFPKIPQFYPILLCYPATMHVIWVAVKHNDRARYGAWSTMKYDNNPEFKTLKGHSFQTTLSHLELQAIFKTLQSLPKKTKVEIRLPKTSEVYRIFTDNTLEIPTKLAELFVQIDKFIQSHELTVSFAPTGKKDQNAMVMLDGPLYQEYKKYLKDSINQQRQMQNTRSFYGTKVVDALIKTSNASTLGAWAVVCVNSRGKLLRRKGTRKNNRECYLDLLSISSVIKSVKDETEVRFFVSNAQTLILLDMPGQLRSRTIKRMVTSILRRIEKKKLTVSFNLLKNHPNKDHVREVTELFQATKEAAKTQVSQLEVASSVNIAKVS